MSGHDDPTLRKWERKIDRMKMDNEDAENGLKAFIMKALKNQDNKHNLAREMIEAKNHNRSTYKGNEEGFNIFSEEDDQVITGVGPEFWQKRSY